MRCRSFALSITLCFSAFFSLAGWCARDDEDSGRDEKQVFHLYQHIDLTTAINIQYDKPRIVVKAVFPELRLNEDSDPNSDDRQTIDTPNLDDFNDTIHGLVQQAITEFKTYVLENNPTTNLDKKIKIRNDFYVDYAASFIRPRKTPIISIRFSTQGVVTGMAHPYHRYFVYNYDLKNEEEISLSDLFKTDSDYLQVLSSYASHQLSRRLAKQFIAEGATPTEAHFNNFNIKANGLLFTFDEGTVAPRFLGAQTVLVPFSAMRDVLSENSVLGKCTIKQQRCGADQLLTGGFIDEAKNSRRIDLTHRRLNPVLSQR